jgi:cell division protein FtsW
VIRVRDTLWLTVLALLGFGVVMVSSAGMSVGATSADGVTFGSIAFSRHTAYLALALAAMAVGAALPAHRLGDSARLNWWVPLLWPASLAALATVYLPVFGHEVNGAARWVRLPGGLTIQPSELAKWATPLVLAWYGWRHAAIMHRFWRGLLPALVILGTVSAAVVVEDLGTGALIAGVGVLVLVAAGARLWHLVLLSPLGLVAVIAAIVSNPYRLTRLRTYLDPFADPEGAGYHIIQSLSAIAGGGVTGRGLGFGLQKFGYLPEDRTDFLFAIVCEELGVVGAAVALCLYAALILGCATITRRQRNLLPKLFGVGVTATIGFQALMNVMVVTGLAPTKGIALPLMSAGGTGWVLTAFSLGLMASLDRGTPDEPEPEPDAPDPDGPCADHA